MSVPFHLPVSRAAERDDRGGTCNIFYLKRRLGVHRFGDRRLVSYVAGLVAGHGFPPPLPCAVKGQGITREVVIGSCWRRDAVDLWFDDFLPPDMADALDRRAARDAGDVMDERATSLRLVG